MSGLFNTFNIAKRGMQAQQTALSITSHNVANANTEGYSVQRAHLKTTEPFGMPSITSAAEPGQVGTGVEVSQITRSRDEFMDIQIRKENSTLGKFSSKDEFLSELETIFMEPSDTGISSGITNFFNAWDQLAATPESSTAKTLVVQNSEALVNGITHTYNQLEDLQVNADNIMKNKIFNVNDNLNQIAELNQQIKAATIGGKIPNDLFDRRDLLLDKLSKDMGFSVTKNDFNGIKISVKQEGGTLTPILNDGESIGKLSFINSIKHETINKEDPAKNTYTLSIYEGGDINKEKKLTLSEADIKKYLKDSSANISSMNDKQLNTCLKSQVIHSAVDNTGKYTLEPMVIESGNLCGYENVKNDIQNFKNQLNKFAKTLAVAVNSVHTLEINLNKNAKINFFDIKDYDDEAAKNIKINTDIKSDIRNLNVGINYKEKGIEKVNPGNGGLVSLMKGLRNLRIDINDVTATDKITDEITDKFTYNFTDKYISVTPPTNDGSVGISQYKYALTNSNTGTTIDNYFKDTIANLGVITQEAKNKVTNQEALINQLETKRASVSGVSLDEEMTNMMQFQKAYEANAKLISVVDQLLEVVVNGLLKR